MRSRTFHRDRTKADRRSRANARPDAPARLAPYRRRSALADIPSLTRSGCHATGCRTMSSSPVRSGQEFRRCGEVVAHCRRPEGRSPASTASPDGHGGPSTGSRSRSDRLRRRRYRMRVVGFAARDLGSAATTRVELGARQSFMDEISCAPSSRAARQHRRRAPGLQLQGIQCVLHHDPLHDSTANRGSEGFAGARGVAAPPLATSRVTVRTGGRAVGSRL
jgi:hypothetical protein